MSACHPDLTALHVRGEFEIAQQHLAADGDKESIVNTLDCETSARWAELHLNGICWTSSSSSISAGSLAATWPITSCSILLNLSALAEFNSCQGVTQLPALNFLINSPMVDSSWSDLISTTAAIDEG